MNEEEDLHVVLASKVASIPRTSMSGLSRKALVSTMLLWMVKVTFDPRKKAPQNSNTAVMTHAWRSVNVFEAMVVANTATFML
jgi:hypothetical protein